jgi:outer membrane protein OmpA-like peptidoglycan-associated protein/Tfp pilus assembly protein PilF
MRFKVFIVIILVALGVTAVAQPKNLTTKNKKATESFYAALEAYERYDLKNAERLLLEAIQRDKNFVEAYLTISQIYQETGRDEECIAAADQATKVNPDFFPSIYYNIANLLFKKGEYLRAAERYTKFLTYRNIRAESAFMAKLKLQNCEFALNAIANPVPFEPINLGSSVNSSLDEYWPSLSADENTLVITVNLPFDTTSIASIYNRQEDFFITHRNETAEWEQVRSMGSPINSPRGNEGAQSLTADGNRMYFTVCVGVCNIFYSDKLPNGEWSKPAKLPEPVNLTNYSEKQPSISPDGRTLYFVSNRPGGKGKFDIWYSHKISDSEWGQPKSIGDTINSPFNEQSPFIHFDNQTLFFASDGHVGMGGLDLYLSRRVNDTLWSKPVNLGYPINTFTDEDGLIVNAKGTTAYYSSDRNTQTGRDIYKFNLYPEARPQAVSYVKGVIRDAKTDWPIKANFSLIDVTTGEEIMKSSSEKNGEYLVCLPANRNYAFMASSPTYLFFSEHFNLKETHSATQPLEMNIYLNPISVGQTMVMRNVFFETASWSLKDESIAELGKLLDLLKQNSTMRIEVGGHTDSVGSDDENITLSEKRAKAVADDLLQKGIASERITWKGYGETKPINSNTTDEGRAKNRRTEIKIIGM